MMANNGPGSAALHAARQAITAACRVDESACVAGLVREMEEIAPDAPEVAAEARRLVLAVREARQGASGVDQLMHEFSLSSREGIALMCLAEALLRIPDTATMDRLIRDKISHGDWRAHLGHNSSLFVNAATWGLMITGRFVASHSAETLDGTLGRLVARGGEPLIRRGVEFAMSLLGSQFVIGETIEAALERSEENVRRGYTHSFDMLGEAAVTDADAARYCGAYETAIEAIGRAAAGLDLTDGPGISVKLSALHPRYCRAQRERVFAELYPRLLGLAKQARGKGIGLNIDAEESERLELSLDLVARLAFEPALDGWPGLGVVVQAYQKRCPLVIDWLARLARDSGRRMMVRLVKGAYWDSEIRRAQQDGQDGYPVFTRKAHTDLCYLVSAGRLLAHADRLYPQFATHNAQTVAAVGRMAELRGVGHFEFQCLHGMGEALYDNVVGGPGPARRRCRIYAPVGTHRTLLPYLVRRLLENGANTSFVNRIVDPAVAVEDLIADPLAQVVREGGSPHPKIVLPQEIHGRGRRNSRGLDLASDPVVTALDEALARLATRRWEAAPILAAGPGGEVGEGEGGGDGGVPVFSPADRSDQVGHVREATPAEIGQAVTDALAFAGEWARRDVGERASILRRCADAFEDAREELISLAVREAGKTWGNAVAEIREAVDFCRYYAQQAEQAGDRTADRPGVVACISPWNFPLAIFVGQVAAALAAGSPVLAKPAEQTALMAALAVRLMLRAGVPRAALQLLPGRGETVGARLAGDPRLGAVVFTGSGEVAQSIDRCLAGRPAERPEALLIAETGGCNAMIVDSSALAEQVVRDVMASAFDSAGQRCSALRVLCLQDEIAGPLLELLWAAMAELQVGDPAALATDVGPVIDEAARDRLEAHVRSMQARGRRVFRRELPVAAAAGCFVAPTLIEIDSVAELEGEVFGPILHVLRFAGDALDDLVDSINAGGYGLTFGIHSRIEESIERVLARVSAGNLYVNRNMIGAVVGVQPFGGHGRSGTGPKAGGPLYLPALQRRARFGPQELGLPLVRAEGGGGAAQAAFAALAAWASRQGKAGLAAACAEYAATTLCGWQAELAGATGERNTLRFEARGPVLCRADGDEALLEQLAAALATGNWPWVEADSPAAGLLAALPAEVRAGICRGDPKQRPAAVLYAGAVAERFRLRRQLAADEGPRVALITADPASGRYPLRRLVRERLVSVDTTAAGGNTSLMMLAV